MKLIAALALGLALMACTARMTSADHCLIYGCDDTTYGVYTQYNQVVQAIRQTGIYKWRYVQEGQTNLSDSIRNSISECAAKFGFTPVESNDAVFRQISSGGMDFIYGNSQHEAGGSWAIGIVSHFLSADSAAVYDADTMAPWGEDSKDEVVEHETCGHSITGIGEGYYESSSACAPTDGGPQVSPNVPVRGFHNSVMNCGLQNSQHIDSFMISAWNYIQLPEKASAVGYDSTFPAVWACGLVPSFAGNPNRLSQSSRTKIGPATRIAVIYWTASRGNYFTGTRPAYSPDSNGCQGIYIDANSTGEERWCGVKPENELSWWKDFNETWVKCG